MGVAASGKTTLSKQILQKINSTYLDNNFIADAFYPDTRNGRNYMQLRPCFYNALYRIVRENLAIGNSVLLDVPHVKEIQNPQWRTFISDLVDKSQTKLIVIRCTCSEQSLKRRIEARGEERDKWKLDNWQEFAVEQPPDVYIPFEHLDVDTDNDLAENSVLALEYIFQN
jgi:predicted kinase